MHKTISISDLYAKKNRYKQIVIICREQKQFNVTIMKFKNSSTYVQKQIDLILKNFREFAKIYIDDIVFFSTFLNQHIEYFYKKFQRFSKYDVILNPKKFFLEYLFIVFLKRIMNVFEMITFEKKFAIIIKLIFSKIFKKLKIYVKLIDLMRNYILYYAQIFESFQKRKILFWKTSLAKQFQKSIFDRQNVKTIHDLKHKNLINIYRKFLVNRIFLSFHFI